MVRNWVTERSCGSGGRGSEVPSVGAFGSGGGRIVEEVVRKGRWDEGTGRERRRDELLRRRRRREEGAQSLDFAVAGVRGLFEKAETSVEAVGEVCEG